MTEDGTKLDMEELSRSLTGFEEIAIQKLFRADFSDLPGTLTARALLFVHVKRGGMNDSDAFKHVMNMPIGEMETHFEIPDAVREAAEGKARARTETWLTPTS